MAPPKGFVPWNKGKHNIYSSETIESNRQKHLGKTLSQEHKEKIRIKMQQRKLSDEHKRKIGIKTREREKGLSFYNKYGLIGSMEMRAKIGSNNWAKKMKGKFPQSTLQKKSQNVLGEKNPQFGIRGELSHAWRGGLKLLPYPPAFNKWFKDEIRKRDNWTCIKCNLHNIEHKKLYKNQSLQVHHLNYRKQDTIPENCCSLCCRCNAEVNHNRDKWIPFFQAILSERYGYTYINGQPIIDIFFTPDQPATKI